MVKTRLIGLGAAVWLLCTGIMSPSVGAPILNFQVDAGRSSITAGLGAGVCLGCFINASLAPGLAGQSFSLEVGDSRSFEAFRLNAGGYGLAGLWLDTQLAFAPGAPVIDNSATGLFMAAGGLALGLLDWQGPPSVHQLADGSSYSLELSSFFANGLGENGSVFATITALEGPVTDVFEAASPVPLPGSLSLILPGLLGLWFWRRHRQPLGGRAGRFA